VRFRTERRGPAYADRGTEYVAALTTAPLPTPRVGLVATLRLPGRDLLLGVVAAPLFVAGTHVATLNRMPPYRALDAIAYGLLVVAGLALALWRARPGTAFALTLACAAAMLARGHAPGPVLLAPLLCLFHLTLRYGLPAGAAATALTGAALLTSDLIGPVPAEANPLLVGFAWFAAALTAYGTATVTLLQRRRRAAEAEAAAARARAQAHEERLAIAREIHDVLGHSLSLISMRAGIALHVADRDPNQAIEALTAIRETGRQALDELRRTLDVIRDRRPAADLDAVKELVAALNAAGHPVELIVTGEPSRLSAATAHAIHRIVQEALTNVVRHAGGASATVRIDHTPGEVAVSVVDDGRTTPGEPGNGIIGMRERVEALHGRFGCGPEPGGGFAVRAWLPTRRRGHGDERADG